LVSKLRSFSLDESGAWPIPFSGKLSGVSLLTTAA
jgi:hypothetical protein